MVHVPTGLDNLKIKIVDSNVGELKNFLMDLKILSDVLSKEAVK